MISRRAFMESVAVTALGIAARGLAAAKGGCPEYYAAYLASVASRIREKARSCEEGFYFITDLHISSNAKQSGHVLAELAGLAPIRKVLCGGDLVVAFSPKGVSDRDSVWQTIDDYKTCWVNPIRESGMQLYTAKGNHDFTIRRDAASEEGYTCTAEEARTVIVETASERDAVVNASDPTGCYYYVDYVKSRVRYIVADTTDAVSSKRAYWAVEQGMHATQLHWLAEKALGTMPSGWSAVVMHHIPVAGVVGNAGEINRFADMRNLLEAYQNRKSVTILSRTFDFSGAQGRILVDLTGHHHAERQTFLNGILHVTEPCDAAYGDYLIGSAPWCRDLPRKKHGTVHEQTFSAVQLDTERNLIHFTRIGGGSDRVIHLTPRTVKAGELTTFQSDVIKDPLEWACYDGDRVTYKKNPANRYNDLVEYHNTFAEVTRDGRMTAHQPGPVMALCYGASGLREYFPVTVV
ncbi:MAG TPA: metallophosphoesterase [Kiritimatiellia bacterium]|nr:metallophosphoesterase [Kiritimatiellia bacterium]HRU70203.1 metallophosphoesterase [Kiritimatiellia bacterium]